MCGIFGALNSNSLEETLTGLSLLEYRGYDSVGVAIKHDGELNITKTVGRVAKLKEIVEEGTTSQLTIGHTRWATHGAVTMENAHPFLSQCKRFCVVHNGIIENYIELREMLTGNGYTFQSQTDSEVVVQLLSYCFELVGSLDSAIFKCVNMLRGAFALVIVTNINDTMYAVKHSSPLCIGVADNKKYVCSDITTLRSFCGNLCFVPDDVVVKVGVNLEFFDFSANAQEVEWFALPQLELANSVPESFMKSEIQEIPYRIFDTFYGYKLPDINCKKYNRIYLVGCGTAYHSGLAIADTFRKLCKVDVFTVLASELNENYIIDKNSLAILITQSGETTDTINSTKFFKNHFATTLAITNVANSSITFVADHCLHIHAGKETAVASTKAYNCQLVALIRLAIDIATHKKTITTEHAEELLDGFCSLPNAVKTALADDDEIHNLAKKLVNSSSVYYLGRQSDLPTAMEGSLKLKEISYTHSEAYGAGELKHGTLALIEKGVTVVVIATEYNLLSKYHTAINEVKSRGANVVVVSPYDFNDETIDKITLPPVTDIFYSVLSVVPLQLFAYHYSKLLGRDIDKPRNLAKSVTVD